MPRYVLLRHECPDGRPQPSHWDLMLEHEGCLRTWALRRLPQAWHDRLSDEGVTQSSPPKCDGDASAPIVAEKLADHRLEYLDYEGPVSRDRGSVRRCCRGTYHAIEMTDDRVAARLGSPLSGSLLLERRAANGADWSVVTGGAPGPV